MTSVLKGDDTALLTPAEQDRLDAALRLHYFSEDWITAPCRAESGAALGPETQEMVLALLRQNADEAGIREVALDALADEEKRIKRKYRTRGLVALCGCAAIAVVSVLTWQGRGEANHLVTMILFGTIGLMVAHALNSLGVRERSRMLRSATARKEVWRKAIAAMWLAKQPVLPT